MMTRKALLAALISLPMSSCTILPEIILFNNADNVATVSIAGDNFSIKPGKSRKVGRDPVHTFKIQLGDTRYSYAVKYWPGEYAYFTGWWVFVDRKIKAQFNADGSILVLTESQTAPVPTDIPQPTGFPLLPEGT